MNNVIKFPNREKLAQRDECFSLHESSGLGVMTCPTCSYDQPEFWLTDEGTVMCVECETIVGNVVWGFTIPT